MKYNLKKLCTLLITVFVISFLAFAAFQIIGDPIGHLLGTEATPEAEAALREQLGFNRPIPVRYFEWLTGFIKGDFGTSYSYNMPLYDMVIPKLGITISLTVFAFLLTVVISIPLGVYQVRKENSAFDRIMTVINQIVMSIPPFFIGILLTCIFGLALRFFTPGLYVSWSDSPLGFVFYLFFPALSIAIPRVAQVVKMLRSNVLEQMKSEYVYTAYSRGMNRRRVLEVHALRNAMIPVATFLAVSLSEMLAASIIIEQIFSIPGIGRLLLSSIGNRDFPVVLAIVVILALWVILVNFAADVLYQFIDPRIKNE